MVMDLTFESACKLVKNEHPELAPDIDAFLNIALATGVATLAVPITVASGATALTPALITLIAIGTLSNLFGVKNDIFKVGERIISKITSKRDQNAHEQYMQMQYAYILICYTAFFETLARDKQLAPLLKKIKMKREEKIRTAIMASKDLWGQSATVTDENEISQGKLAMFKYEISMPQPGDTFETQQQCLTPLYEQLAKRVAVFFELETIRLHVQSEQEKIKQALTELPKKAWNTFLAEYNTLAMKFPEFAVWLNLQKDDKIIRLTEQSRQLLESISRVEQQQTNAVLRLLATRYKSIVDVPIIDDPDSELTYPKKRDIFIPQSFKVTHYKGSEQLKESFWNSLPERHDLEDFLRAYFNHEESSTKTPLIILGQPGSGKSILTSMIAAKLVPLPLTPIKVELRHTNAEDPISTQIEGQIRRDTDRNFDWATLRDHTINSPVLVLFDGYDELLQVTGKVFSGYLNQIKEFQMRQLALSEGQQSVRAVVTSRFTLIDKAVIPSGSTVIRLLEFDEERQKRWIDKWNEINTSYFQQSHTEPFKLPQDYENIKRLAEQPLLLMMLAIYDAKGNPLSKAASDLDQSLLYDRLLRRFIERELQKNEESAQSWQEYELDEVTDHEMERLGVAAIGMFNRRKVSIQTQELDADLKFFGLEESALETAGYEDHTATGQMGHQLLPSEKLFGSFFFQKLESVRKTEVATRDSRSVPIRLDDTAYEFLHNTFGEFLTADFMLRKILEETGNIRDQANKRSARGKRFSRSMPAKIDLATFDKTWYACFMYAPLFSRPVVLRLLHEWSRHCLQKEGRDIREFLEDFDTIIINHINNLLSDNNLPSLMTSDQRLFAAFSTIGYISIYTLNLLLLRTFLGNFDDGYTFDETNYAPSEDGTRAWDRLTYLWRSWFSLETLKELAAVLKTERDDTKLQLFVRKKPDFLLPRNRLSLVNNVSQTLADNIIAGLSGLLLHDAFRDDSTELDNITKQLKDEQIDKNLSASLFVKRFRHLQRQNSIRQEDALKIFDEVAHENLLQDNHEAAASLYVEMSNVLYYIIDEIGLEFEVDISDYMTTPPNSYELEAFNLLKRSKEKKLKIKGIMEWFIDGIWAKTYIINKRKHFKDVEATLENMLKSIRYSSFLEEVIQYMLRYGSWSVPKYLSLEELQRFAFGKNVFPMNLAATIIQLADEVGEQNVTNFIYQHYLKNMKTPEASMPIKLATELIKLARERGDGHTLYYFMHFLLEKLREDNYVLVELALEVIKFALEVGDQQALTQFLYDYLKDLVNTQRHIPTVFTIELLKLVNEINGEQLIDLLTFYISQVLERSNYIQPELALEILKFTTKLKDSEHFGSFKNQYLANMLQTQQLVSIELAVEVIKLALQSKENNSASIENFYRKNITSERCYLGLLPIDTIVDLRQLAQTFGDDVLLQKINERLKL